MDPEGDPPPGKSQVAIICFLRNTGTDPIEKQLNPRSPIASRETLVRPSVKYPQPPLTEIYDSAHDVS